MLPVGYWHCVEDWTKQYSTCEVTGTCQVESSFKPSFTFLLFYSFKCMFWGGCSSAGRAGRLVIERSLVQIPAPGRAALHVEVSLSKILNPTLLISKGPVMNWRLVQGVPCPRHETRLGLAPAAKPRDPMERDKLFGQWHDILRPQQNTVGSTLWQTIY